MVWLWLALLLAIAAVCSWFGPGSSLHRSAWQAFYSSVFLLSQGGTDDGRDEDDDEEETPQPTRSVQAAPRPAREPRSQPVALLKTSAIRKRVTPLIQKRVAVRYGFKCAICRKPLDESWETDHIIPLSSARTAADFERLNSLENLQPVHRIPCHQMKSSREAAVR